MKHNNGNTIVQQNKIDWPEMNDRESTSMDCNGNSPWSNDSCPEGVWCWDADEDEVLVGTCPDECEIVSYRRAIEIFSN